MVNLIRADPEARSSGGRVPLIYGQCTVVSTGHTTQAEGYRPGLVGPGMIVRTYTFLMGKVVVRGEGRSGFFDYARLCIYIQMDRC
jgi:hypothetical protein